MGRSPSEIEVVEFLNVFRRMEPNTRTGTLHFLLNTFEARLAMGVDMVDFLKNRAVAMLKVPFPIT